MSKYACDCGTEFEYDDWDFNNDKYKCPNPDCKQLYRLKCEEYQLEDGSWEHDHYLEKA